VAIKGTLERFERNHGEAVGSIWSVLGLNHI